MHHRYPKELVLKDGTDAILKPLEAEDGDALLRFYSQIPLEDRWFMKEDGADPSVIRKWATDLDTQRVFSILAWMNHRVVAHATLVRHVFGGLKHVGHLRIMVAPEVRRKRLGTWMLLDLIRRAMDSGIERLRSDFVVGLEDSAIEAAYKLDFTKECVLRDFVQDQDGRYRDYQIMVKHLHTEWSDF